MAIRETSAGHEALGLDEDDLRRMHYHMLLARRVDERSWILNRQGKAVRDLLPGSGGRPGRRRL